MKFKKTLALLLAVIVVSTLVVPTVFAESGVVHIASVEDMRQLAKNCVLDTYSKKLNVVLDCDIDFEGEELDPIPTFSGTFNGNGHTISNFVYDSEGSHQGLFRYVEESGVVKNLTVEANIEPEGSANQVGGIVGTNRGTIEKCVFEDHDCTMDELIKACDANFEGYERLRQLLLNKPEKFGNNCEHVDSIYREFMHFIADNVQTWHDARGGWYSFNVHSQTVNVSHGEVTGALPDGRLSGMPLCDNASPMMGRDISGPTATVKSVAAMKPENFYAGALFNLRFDPRSVQGRKGIDTIEEVVTTFFNEGGQHIQINVVDNETLRAAQEHPEDYRGLVVRVAGYLAYFTELDRHVQDALIERTAHGCGCGC